MPGVCQRPGHWTGWQRLKACSVMRHRQDGSSLETSWTPGKSHFVEKRALGSYKITAENNTTKRNTVLHGPLLLQNWIWPRPRKGWHLGGTCMAADSCCEEVDSGADFESPKKKKKITNNKILNYKVSTEHLLWSKFSDMVRIWTILQISVRIRS